MRKAVIVEFKLIEKEKEKEREREPERNRERERVREDGKVK